MMFKHLLPIMAAAALMSASPVFAHAKLQSSSPAADAILSAAPQSLTLRFSENVQLAVLKLSLAGKDIPVVLDRGAAAAAQVTLALPALAAGKYQVRWSALSPDDGHVATGTFSFVIAGQT
jgi:methionine-rich copper-binding protein CopC